MFIDKNSLKIKTTGSYISLGQYLTEVEYQYNKLWASDSGRNLAGVQSGTLIGIFPKLVCHFRKLSKAELNTLAPILDSAYQTVQYYDPNKNTTITMTTYSGDWSVSNRSILQNQPFNISFIATRKRS